MTTEIDRCARAMWDKLPGKLCLDDWSANSERYCQAAIACIEALLPASDAVAAAMVSVMKKAQDEHRLTGVEDYFTAAIRAITREG